MFKQKVVKNLILGLMDDESTILQSLFWSLDSVFEFYEAQHPKNKINTIGTHSHIKDRIRSSVRNNLSARELDDFVKLKKQSNNQNGLTSQFKVYIPQYCNYQALNDISISLKNKSGPSYPLTSEESGKHVNTFCTYKPYGLELTSKEVHHGCRK